MGSFREGLPMYPPPGWRGVGPVGCRVRVHGLVKKPEYNNVTGTIIKEAPEGGRWCVLLERPHLDKELSLKLDNVEVVRNEDPVFADWAVQGKCGTPLMFAVHFLEPDLIPLVFKEKSRNRILRHWVDMPDPVGTVTPLMAISFREDDHAVKIAQMLLDAGARADTPDSSVGATPLTMAAQNGRPNLLHLLIRHGAKIDHVANATDPTSTTQAIWLAAQFGHASCVAVLVNAAAKQQKDIVDATNREGKTPCSIALQMGHAAVVGVLIKAGADVRRASPAYYSKFSTEDGTRKTDLDPTPACPVHHSIDKAVRSFATKTCCGCGKAANEIKVDNASAAQGATAEKSLSRCGKCALAYFCSRECQLSAWPSHKRACADLHEGALLVQPAAPQTASSAGAAAEGGGAAVTGDGGGPGMAGQTKKRSKGKKKPPKAPSGFVDAFEAVDDIYDGPEGNYDRDQHPVWEYDAGARGHAEWVRFPARIEAACENMSHMRAPKFMYCPGKPDNDGLYECPLSATPPANVATRHISFTDMTEREVYTGASRAVRRNGKRQPPRAGPSFFDKIPRGAQM